MAQCGQEYHQERHIAVEGDAVHHPVRAHTQEHVLLATLVPNIPENALFEVHADKSEVVVAVGVVREYAFSDAPVMDIVLAGAIIA